MHGPMGSSLWDPSLQSAGQFTSAFSSTTTSSGSCEAVKVTAASVHKDIVTKTNKQKNGGGGGWGWAEHHL